ncbi:MAG: hypothetical protein PUC18_05990 [Prevotellaceae bacterium]|nr:hypothetical protein [Prevotellaceae bacterium]
MSTKNNRILAPEGGRYPFKVSDEYFDSLTARIMEQIDSVEQEISEKKEKVPAQSTKLFDIHKNRRRNLWISTISIAASLVLIATVALKFIPMPSSTPVEQQKAETNVQYTPENYNEDLMNYTMVDNVDVYYYLSSEDFGE